MDLATFIAILREVFGEENMHIKNKNNTEVNLSLQYYLFKGKGTKLKKIKRGKRNLWKNHYKFYRLVSQ